MKRTFLFLLVSIVPLLLSGQGRERNRIFGHIADAATGVPIQYATVWAYNAQGREIAVASSTREGAFFIVPNRAGEYKLVFGAMGYAADSLRVGFDGSNVELDTIKLTEGQKIAEVTVAGRRQLIEQQSDRLIYDVLSDPDAKRLKMSEMMEKIPSLVIKPSDGKLEFSGQNVTSILINGERHEMINTKLQFPIECRYESEGRCWSRPKTSTKNYGDKEK